jgi:DNA processing protein
VTRGSGERALEHGGRTVAVVGTGLRRTYPAKNASLQPIARETAVIAQFWPDAPPTKTSFPMREHRDVRARARCVLHQ